MKKNKQNNFGFTLIEMMIVIAIIGILAGAIVLNNQKAVDKAIDAKVRIFANSIPVTLAGSYVAQWKFDELSTAKEGAIIRDSWGSNNCTLYTGSDGLEKISSNCVDGNCISFDGSNDYLDCGNDNIVGGFSAVTAEAWVYPTANDLNILHAYGNVLLLHLHTSASAGFYLTGGDNTASGYINYKSNAIKLNKWNYIVATWDGSIMKLYVNNDLQGQLSFNGGSTGKLRSGSKFWIGNYFNTWQTYFSGLIDGVRIYNQALSAEKIQENYLAGLKELLAKGKISQAEYAAKLDEFNKNLVQK